MKITPIAGNMIEISNDKVRIFVRDREEDFEVGADYKGCIRQVTYPDGSVSTSRIKIIGKTENID